MANGKWVTINGAHVYLEEGQSPMSAFIKQKGGEKEDKPNNLSPHQVLPTKKERQDAHSTKLDYSLKQDIYRTLVNGTEKGVTSEYAIEQAKKYYNMIKSEEYKAKARKGFEKYGIKIDVEKDNELEEVKPGIKGAKSGTKEAKEKYPKQKETNTQKFKKALNRSSVANYNNMYNEYKKMHPNTKMTLNDFANMMKDM